MSDIKITECVEDKSSQFNLKKFKIGNKVFEFPEKTVDVRYISQKFTDIIKTKNPILEKSKTIKNFDQIKKIVESNDEKQINDFFDSKKWTNYYFKTINLTFEFNPFKDTNDKLKELEPFLEYYYTHSKNILTIPNISIKFIDVDDYIKFVDFCYDFLNSMNSKPIFVPISTRFGMTGIKKLLAHYLKKERYYIWFDFEGMSLNENASARIRHIRRTLNEKGIFDKCVVYFTNIKREISSNIKADNSAASDILSSIGGANIVGINRDPQKFNPNAPIKKVDQKELWKHKARYFDNETYYYSKFKDGTLELKNLNILKNTSRLQGELDNQTKVFLETYKIKDYITKKPIVKDYPVVFKNILY
ncbi:MAG: hypothetical protein AABX83_01425 [Nanoarchaeota archaeon]